MPSWTVNAANFTPFQRRQLSCVALPLNPGEYYAAARARISDRITLAGVEGEAWASGPLYPNGSVRRLRAYFPVQLAAGAAGHGLNYPHPILRFDQLTATLTPGVAETLAPFAEHAAVDLGRTVVVFNYQLEEPGLSPVTHPVREVTVSLADGSVTDYRTGASLPAAARIDLDAGSKLAQRYILAGRIFPEYMGGSVAEPPVFVRLYVEVPADDRAVRVDYEIGNFLITDDSPTDPTWPQRGDPSRNTFVHAAAPILRVVMPSEPTAPLPRVLADNNGITVHQRSVFHREPTNFGLSRLIQVCEARAEASDLGMTYCHRGQLTVFYPAGTPLTQLEQDTAEAIAYDDGDQAVVDLMADDWAVRTRAVGPIGALDDGVPEFWSTREEQREAAGALAYNDLQFLKGRESRYDIPPDSLHGMNADNSRGGPHPEFGSIHFHWLLCSGWPDLRAARLSSMLDGNRKMTRRYLDCTPLRPWEARHRGAIGGEAWTDVVYLNGTVYDDVPQVDCLGRRINSGSAGNARDCPSAAGAWSTIDDQHYECGIVSALAGVLSGDAMWSEGINKDHAAQVMCHRFTFEQTNRRASERVWGINAGRSERAFKIQAWLAWAVDDPDYSRYLVYQLASRLEWLHAIGTRTGGDEGLDNDADLTRELAVPYPESFRGETYLHGRLDSWHSPLATRTTFLGICVPYMFCGVRMLEETDPAEMPSGVAPRDIVQIASDARWMCERMSRVIPLYGFQVTSIDTHGYYRPAWELSHLHHPTDRGAVFDVVARPELLVMQQRNSEEYDNDIVRWDSLAGGRTRLTVGSTGGNEGLAFAIGDVSVVVSGFTGNLAPMNGTHVGRFGGDRNSISTSAGLRIIIDYDSSDLGSGGTVTGPIARYRRGTPFAIFDGWADPPGSMPDAYASARLLGVSVLGDLLNPAEQAVFDRVSTIFFDPSIGHVTTRYSVAQPMTGNRGTAGWSSNFWLHWGAGLRDDAFDRLTSSGPTTHLGQAIGDAGADGDAIPTGTQQAEAIGDAGADGQAVASRVQLRSALIVDGGAEGFALAEVIDDTTSPLIVFASALGDAGADGQANGTHIGPPGVLQYGNAFGDAGADGASDAASVFAVVGQGDGGADALGDASLILAPTSEGAGDGTRQKTGPETIRERTGSPAERVVRNVRTSRGENRFTYTRTIRNVPGKPDRRPIKTGRP